MLAATLAFAGCALPMHSIDHRTIQGSTDRISITTHDRATFDFHEGWELTMRGVQGHADIYPSEGGVLQADTTLSYWNVSSAADTGGRGNTTTKFLLTILGIILVIGLAALILYAAFPATNR